MELVDTEQISKSMIDLKILVFPIVFKIVSNEFILWVFLIIKSCQLSNFFRHINTVQQWVLKLINANALKQVAQYNKLIKNLHFSSVRD